MKRFTLLVASIVALLATSCVQADVEDTLLVGGDELVTISLEGPTMGARAEEITIGKGLKATQLQYAIYDEDWNCLKVVTDETFDSGLKKELKLRLVKNKTYNFVFWAQAPNKNYYTVNLGAVGATAVEPTISVAYGTDANDDYRDAFFGNLTHKVEGSAPVTVYLKRPFAQINFGTNDVEDAKAMGFDVANATTSFKVVAHDTLNLKSGVSSGDVTVERTFVANELPENKTLSTDAKGDYHWVAMNYILWADADNLSLSTCEMTIAITGQEPIVVSVPNAPARRNWRTNLVGSLLTQEGSIFVEIVPETVNDYNGVIEVATAEQFNAAFADPGVDFIVLADDITLTTSATRSTDPVFTISAGESLTINLNNHRLTAATPLLFNVLGELRLINGTIENTNGQVLASNDDVTLSNVTIIQTTDSAYYDEEGDKLELLAEGVAKISENEIAVIDSCGMSWFDANLDAYNGFEGMTIKLYTDIDLLQLDANGEAICFDPIGSYRFDKVFKGTFDGQDHIIKNMNQNTWALDNGYYYNDCGMGLFGAAQDATIKNIKMDKASISGESALCGIIVAVAENVTFENITVTNSKCADYQYYAGGIAGWVSGDNNKFINCNVDASTTIGGQWGDFANANGGVIGGTSGNAKIHMENCNVACQIDAHNDVVSSYQWYIYRRCGMLIGDTGARKAVDGRNYADAPQLTCKNVTVTYGEWANYTYCQFTAMGYPWVRVQAGISCEAYSNIRYGHPTDANGNTVVDDNHVHNEGEGHHVLIEFDQLLGGGANGNGRDPVYGTKTFEGVTVIYNNK